jgi:tetratricopeptide (TPR) repeat protein
MQAGQYENALQLYDQHAERLLAENSEKVLQHLHTIIGHVRENPDSLQKLLELFNKAGETTHTSEVLELLAHASVQSGDLPRARDLYQRLAQLEPQNPLHMQNYQQVVSQLGGTSGAKLITPEEAVVLIDDLEATAPAIHQHYSDEVALSVRSALTDAELFISYNMPAKALGPLVAALPLAPNDLRLNQRLAALHTRASRFAEAALCCRTLQSVYSDAGYPDEATRYGELAERYEERSSTSETPAAQEQGEEEHIYLDAAPQTSEPAVEVAEFSVGETSEQVPETEEVAAEEEVGVEQAASPWPAAQDTEEITVEAEPEFAVVDESASADATAASSEIDLSSEWDDSVTVEADSSAEVESAGVEEQAVEEVAEVEPPAVAAQAGHKAAQKKDAPKAGPAKAGAAKVDSAKVDETIEEIRFYLGHSMPEQAMAALAKLQTLTNDQAKIAELRAEVEAATEAAAEKPVAAEETVEELTADDIPSADVEVAVEPEVAEEVHEAPAAIEEPVAIEPESPAEEEVPVVAEPVAEVSVEAPTAVASPEPEPVRIEPEPVVAHASEPAGVLKDFVSDLESSLGDSFLPGTVTKPVEAPIAPAAKAPAHAPAAHTAPVTAAQNAPVLGEFVADIEASLGEDFLKAAPVAPAAPVAVAPPVKQVPAPAAQSKTDLSKATPPKVSPPLAASAAASAVSSPAPHPTQPPAPVTPAPVASVAWAAPAAQAPVQPPSIPVSPAPGPAASAAKGSPFGEDAGVDLAEMFGELKQDLEAGVSSNDDDPETHYNLGIAFREMGLLDEAIGELQKACQSCERGHPFPQVMQTYTWLAQCFLEKGVPEAAVRWYDKALDVPGIDGETRVALHYELASAYETAGDKTSALKHFMNVYGTNIDYRDVAERIKALKS